MTVTPDELKAVAAKQSANPYSVAPWVIERNLVQAAERIEQQADRIEGLSADLRMAVQTAYQRGATEWARLNYPGWIEWLEASDAAEKERAKQ